MFSLSLSHLFVSDKRKSHINFRTSTALYSWQWKTKVEYIFYSQNKKKKKLYLHFYIEKWKKKYSYSWRWLAIFYESFHVGWWEKKIPWIFFQPPAIFSWIFESIIRYFIEEKKKKTLHMIFNGFQVIWEFFFFGYMCFFFFFGKMKSQVFPLFFSLFSSLCVEMMVALTTKTRVRQHRDMTTRKKGKKKNTTWEERDRGEVWIKREKSVFLLGGKKKNPPKHIHNIYIYKDGE